MTGINGQSNDSPLSFFVTHVLVQYDVGNGPEWFDPNYGTRYDQASELARTKAFEDGVGVQGSDGVVAGYFKIQAKVIDETKVNGGTDVNGDGAMGQVNWGLVLIRKNVIGTNEMNSSVTTK